MDGVVGVDFLSALRPFKSRDKAGDEEEEEEEEEEAVEPMVEVMHETKAPRDLSRTSSDRARIWGSYEGILSHQ